METFKYLAYLWYNNYPHQSLGIIVCSCIGAVFFIGRFLYDAWNDNITNYDDGPIWYIVHVLAFGLAISMVLFFAFPLILLVGSLYLINMWLSKWGNNYRELEKTKEKRREEVLRDMLNSDPIFMEKYKELMKSTPEI